MARCPECNTEYVFDFPTIGKTKADWDLSRRAGVHFVTTCPRCKEIFRAGTEDYLFWKEEQFFSRDEGVFSRGQDFRVAEKHRST